MLTVDNFSYLSQLHKEYLDNPANLSIEWQEFFRQIDMEQNLGEVPTPLQDLDSCLRGNEIKGRVRNSKWKECTHYLSDKLNNLDPLELSNSNYRNFKNYRQIEFLHIQNQAQKNWIQARIDNQAEVIFDPIFKDLTKAELFEQFLNTKFPGAKRFSLEGAESLIPALECLLEKLSQYKVKEVIFGMAHRGRLSVLTNVLKQPMYQLLSQFLSSETFPYILGDVKYHLGYSSERDYESRKLHLTLADNPSHLESVNPVVLGKVRARQDILGDKDRKQVIGVLIHGDAAFTGQGITAESLQLSKLQGYKTGGTIHIIINNQIGFTTNPIDSRSCTFSTDIIKAIQAPIFHVNGDHPEEVVWITKLACDFHHEFATDVVIDLVCYRRLGHNEGDEPSFTQPLMYKKIESHPTTRTLYLQRLQSKSLGGEAIINLIEQEVIDHINTEFAKAQKYIPTSKILSELPLNPVEGVNIEKLQQLGGSLCKIPNTFTPHPKIHKWLTQRLEKIKAKEIDWGLAESLAFASLLSKNIPIRLSGQDSSRGTFSHRHAVLIDNKTGNPYTPLNHLGITQSTFEIIDSPLAEASVLGFEYGYSTINPNTLVLWEAQFGDFANGAQIIIDEFISCAQAKWGKSSNLVMLLPHGIEGQGPDHSSARLERYLQLSAQDNWQILNCSTPANYFHALRRQILSNMRKPLIIMTPKSLLRHKMVVSNLNEMDKSTCFQKVIKNNKIKDAKRLILCSGKIYYELLQMQQLHKINDVAIIRIEQLYPFPSQELADLLRDYIDSEIVWCQEEPVNMGAWFFVEKEIEKILINLKTKISRPNYIGRIASASPTTGALSHHEKTQKQIIKHALITSEYLNHEEVIYVKNYHN